MKSCICVLGWYFPHDFFESLADIPRLDVYIISHRPLHLVPDMVKKTLPDGKLIITDDIGYDWGGYQQFLSLKHYLDYDLCFFCHDDVWIKKTDLFEVCLNRLSNSSGSLQIIGNGRQTFKRDYPRTHIQSYAHSRWKPPSWHFLHDTVRGSFWATSREVLRLISPLEVLWDRRKLIGVGAGNWSLRATCGKAQDILGDSAFTYLSDNYMTSDYLDEYARGKSHKAGNKMPPGWVVRNRMIVAFSRVLMTLYMNSRSISSKNRLALIMTSTFDRL